MHKARFFCSLWNLFDFFIVTVAVVETWILRPMNVGANLRMLSTLRVVRMYARGAPAP